MFLGLFCLCPPQANFFWASYAFCCGFPLILEHFGMVFDTNSINFGKFALYTPQPYIHLQNRSEPYIHPCIHLKNFRAFGAIKNTIILQNNVFRFVFSCPPQAKFFWASYAFCCGFPLILERWNVFWHKFYKFLKICPIYTSSEPCIHLNPIYTPKIAPNPIYTFPGVYSVYVYIFYPVW